jgi:hypothetical protein
MLTSYLVFSLFCETNTKQYDIEKIKIISFDWMLHPNFAFDENFIINYNGFYYTPENR